MGDGTKNMSPEFLRMLKENGITPIGENNQDEIEKEAVKEEPKRRTALSTKSSKEKSSRNAGEERYPVTIKLTYEEFTEFNHIMSAYSYVGQKVTKKAVILDAVRQAARKDEKVRTVLKALEGLQ